MDPHSSNLIEKSLNREDDLLRILNSHRHFIDVRVENSHFFGEKKGPPNEGPFLCNAWCWLQDLNPPPPDYKSGALPDELSRLNLRNRIITI